MYTQLWIIEWRERGRGEEAFQTASTPEEAVETIQSFLRNETAFDESTDQDRPAFDVLFDERDPMEVVQRLDDSLEQECEDGKLTVRRAMHWKKQPIRPAVPGAEAEDREGPMTAKMTEKLKEHFLKWSGGFPPESEHQITVYVDYAAETKDDESVREALRAWMNEDFDFEPSISEVSDTPVIAQGTSDGQSNAADTEQDRAAPASAEAATKLLEFARLFLAYHDNETDDSVTIEMLENAARAAVAQGEVSA